MESTMNKARLSPGQPASAGEALAWLDRALAYLAGADAVAMTSAEQADCLRALERAEARQTAARSAVLAAFTVPGGGMESDGQGSARTWLTWQTRVSRPAASGAVIWMQRLNAHPLIAAALASGAISASWARQIAEWTDRLGPDSRASADGILLGAAAGGVDLAGLSELAEEICRRLAPVDIDPADDRFGERQLRLATHFRGAGKLDGDLTARCAEALATVLDTLGKRAGPEDSRTLAQRHHDALEEMCLRLLASGGLPDRAGQPARLMLHMTLPDLTGAGSRDGRRSNGGTRTGFAGLGAAAVPGDDCDAVVIPVVTGHLDASTLADEAAAFLAAADQPSAARLGQDRIGRSAGQLVLDWAVRLLSGPAGLAAALRTGNLTGPAAAISLPLDIGAATDTIPAHLRRGVILRDRHCRFPGCEQAPAACDVHHILHREDGGPTSLPNLLLLCRFHHLIAIHRWGWAITLHSDGTTTAVSPGQARVFHSHERLAS
jgi:Domain of unknown function (DUF222)